MRKPITPYWPSFHGPQTGQGEPQLPERTMLEGCMGFIEGCAPSTRDRVRALIEEEQLGAHLRARYPTPHELNTNKQLRGYTNLIKAAHLKTTERLSKVCFDDKLHLIHHALGTQTFISHAHGGQLKARRELRVSSLFKRSPEPLLRMIVVHELAHLREREHNAAFYRLCVHMEERYHQLEFDARLYLIHHELFGPLYPTSRPDSIPRLPPQDESGEDQL